MLFIKFNIEVCNLLNEFLLKYYIIGILLVKLKLIVRLGLIYCVEEIFIDGVIV